MLPAKLVCETCFQFNLPLLRDQLALLVQWCSGGEGRDGGGEKEGEEGKEERREGDKVRYYDLMELLDWQRTLSGDVERRVLSTTNTGRQWSVSPVSKA